MERFDKLCIIESVEYKRLSAVAAKQLTNDNHRL